MCGITCYLCNLADVTPFMKTHIIFFFYVLQYKLMESSFSYLLTLREELDFPVLARGPTVCELSLRVSVGAWALEVRSAARIKLRVCNGVVKSPPLAFISTHEPRAVQTAGPRAGDFLAASFRWSAGARTTNCKVVALMAQEPWCGLRFTWMEFIYIRRHYSHLAVHSNIRKC